MMAGKKGVGLLTKSEIKSDMTSYLINYKKFKKERAIKTKLQLKGSKSSTSLLY